MAEKPPTKSILTVALISGAYLLFTGCFMGIKIEHLLIVFLYNFLYIISSKTRKFILAFTVFVVFGILYDVMKIFPNYHFNNIDIEGIYRLEKGLFGITWNNVLLTPNEFFVKIQSTFLDILSGLFYINWVPVPLAFGFYLFLKNKQQFLQFSIVFLFVNVIGFCIYYIHPAAPPWYVSMYGFDLHLHVPGNPAGLARFDDFFHAKIFGSIYSRNSNVFAAMPSLHCSYPVIVLYYACKCGLGKVKYLLAIFMLGIWFAAVYSGHHYVIDVVMGILCAIAGIGIFEKLIFKIKIVRLFLSKYLNAIS